MNKFWYAIDNTKTQDVGFLGAGFISVPLKESWKKMVDFDIGICADICVYKSSTGHVELSSYNKMRVFLAIHICSQTVIQMTWDYCESHEDGNTKEYDTVIEVLEKIDQTVDITNCC
jgi:hypothetical protein